MLVPPRSAAENMSRDTALMDRARETGESVFSVYSWAHPTLSLGRNQEARGKYNLDAIALRGMDVVRRPTGGRALLHHREVTYSVTAPAAAGDSLSESYARINALLLLGLSSLGIAANESPAPGRALPPTDIPCFAEPAKGELSFEDRKLVGSAQFREDGALLQHGSILIEDDQALIAAVSMSPPSIDAVAAATLSDALGRRPSIDEVAVVLFNAVLHAEDASASSLSEADVSGQTAKYMEKYSSEWWTWRR